MTLQGVTLLEAAGGPIREAHLPTRLLHFKLFSDTDEELLVVECDSFFYRVVEVSLKSKSAPSLHLRRCLERLPLSMGFKNSPVAILMDC